MPGQATVKVTKDESFGPIVKNYVFNFVPDTTLRSLRVNGKPLASFKPGVLTYNAVMNAGRRHDRERAGRRERPRRHGQRRAGDHADRAGPGDRHQRQRVVGLHRQPGHHERGQRRVRLARLAVADPAPGREPLARRPAARW